MLEKLTAASPAGPARAEFGGRLAAMRMEQGDASGALAALTKSAAEGLPPPLLESRTMTFARAAAAVGDLPSAAAALAALDTLPAAGLRANLLEAARDWPAALAALRDLSGRTVPPDGQLTEPQARIVLRLAAAAAQTGDDAILAALRVHDTPRLPEGKLAEMFRLLTADPVRGVADLPRAANEVKLAREVTASLKALTPLTRSPRANRPGRNILHGRILACAPPRVVYFPPPWPQGAHAFGVMPNRPSTGWKGRMRDERTHATGDGLGFPEREPD